MPYTNLIILLAVAFVILSLFTIIRANQKQSKRTSNIFNELNRISARLDEQHINYNQFRDSIDRLFKQQTTEMTQTRDQANQHQLKNIKTFHESLNNGMHAIRTQLTESMNQNSKRLTEQVEKLTQAADSRLKEISGEVDKRLSEGFEKTTATFTDVIKRLALIDDAQKKITELSSNVISLQEILSDKRSRGVFGEVQLTNLIRNVMPESAFALQHTLSNGRRVDCMLFLPEPTGHVAVDSKFPLENFQKLAQATPDNKKTLQQQAKADIKKHIDDIASKYIIENETADGAMMFIPAESIFAEIHSNFPELVQLAHKKRVWLVSPTTMMAILTTARAVLKDEATRKQVHIIQSHLGFLSKDFDRFQIRMSKLAKHIQLANQDVEDVHRSSRKITDRFNKIERVEIQADAEALSQTTDEIISETT